ncbi:MAG: hypothetical protein QOE34_1793 [Verrucomicrobiota bacterium]
MALGRGVAGRGGRMRGIEGAGVVASEIAVGEGFGCGGPFALCASSNFCWASTVLAAERGVWAGRLGDPKGVLIAPGVGEGAVVSGKAGSGGVTVVEGNGRGG